MRPIDGCQLYHEYTVTIPEGGTVCTGPDYDTAIVEAVACGGDVTAEHPRGYRCGVCEPETARIQSEARDIAKADAEAMAAYYGAAVAS
jgi:hypothetical protein